MGNENQTTNYLQIKSQLVINLLTNETFRHLLMEEQNNIVSGHASTDKIKKILKNNGYSEDMASEFVIKKGDGYEKKLDIEMLIESKVAEVMPDDVEMMTLGGFNLNW